MPSIRRLLGAPFNSGNLCAGAQNPIRLAEGQNHNPTVAGYVELISAERQNSAASALRLCRHYADADRDLDNMQKKQLIEALGIDRSGYERRVKVGQDQRLYDPRILARLPNSYTTLHKLAGLDHAEFEQALDCIPK